MTDTKLVAQTNNAYKHPQPIKLKIRGKKAWLNEEPIDYLSMVIRMGRHDIAMANIELPVKLDGDQTVLADVGVSTRALLRDIIKEAAGTEGISEQEIEELLARVTS